MAIQTSQAMKNLIDLGKEHGYLTLEEISRTVSQGHRRGGTRSATHSQPGSLSPPSVSSDYCGRLYTWSAQHF